MADHGAEISSLTLVTLAGVMAVVLSVGYVRAARRARGRPWPPLRTCCWAGAMVGVVVAGLLAVPGGHDPVRHMTLHVVLAMAVPLLLARSAPITLALCVLPVRTARRLVAALRSRPVMVLTNPFVAAALDAGGLWLLFRTPLLRVSEHHQVVEMLVWVHLVAAGWLLSTVLVGADRGLHRSPFAVRALVLLLVSASHDVLAKLIYADATDDRSQTGAMIMYYAGDLIHVAMMIALCAAWLALCTHRERSPALRVGVDHRGASASEPRAQDPGLAGARSIGGPASAEASTSCTGRPSTGSGHGLAALAPWWWGFAERLTSAPFERLRTTRAGRSEVGAAVARTFDAHWRRR